LGGATMGTKSIKLLININIMKQRFETHASNGYIGIMVSKDGEMVKYQFQGSEPSRKWQRIKYDRNDEPFFVVKSQIYYLKDFLRTNI
jgi:hypothetical protein